MKATVCRLDPQAAERLGLSAVPRDYKQEIYAVRTAATPAQLFRVITGLGGANGWYYGDWLWTLRGWLDRLIGGVGIRRSAARPKTWQAGDILDFWRVDQVDTNCAFALRAEMKIGGDGRLGFYLFPAGEGSLLIQRTLFRPAHWLGKVYWSVSYPIHALVFRGLAGAIARRAEALPK
jgi:hypothetical protein